MARRMRIQPVAIVLVVVAVVLLVIGIIYLTQTANHLPSGIPGKPSARQLKLPICNTQLKSAHKPCFTPRKFTKRGIAATGLAVVALVGAWYTSGLRRSSSRSVSSGSSDATT
jgi:hypothetical protein